MFKSWGHGWYWIGLLFLLSSCGQREGLAPVVEPNWRVANQHATRHVVSRGETLYAIAFRYDNDYRTLARINHLSHPYRLHVGQVLYLHRAPAAASPIHLVVPTLRRKKIASKPSYHALNKGRTSRWVWPARGHIVVGFHPSLGKKGINIAGKKGEKIRAAAAGEVAYAGNGLSGYGNLIIIKHDRQYLTAYGNNLRNLVHEGQLVQAGQVIAEMGVVDRRYWGVHFEIRYSGKPVNPVNYLK